MKMWVCKIGGVGADELLDGADSQMRQAIRKAYMELTGWEPQFISSGWRTVSQVERRALVSSERKRARRKKA